MMTWYQSDQKRTISVNIHIYEILCNDSIKTVIHLTIKVKIQHLNILKENSLTSKTTLEK